MNDVARLPSPGEPSRVKSSDSGNLGGKKVTLEKTPIFAALIVIGIIALSAAGVGAASFGAHHGVWAAGSLSNINQIAGISMMAAGGSIGIGALVGGITGLAKTRKKKASEVAAVSSSPPRVPLELKGTKAQGTSYDSRSDDVIADLVYCDPDKGFACVVDGTGHNNSRMRNALKEHFDPFIANYTDALSNGLETTREGAQTFFESQMGTLDELFKDSQSLTNKRKVCKENEEGAYAADRALGTFQDPTFKPAMSFVQLVSSGDRLLLFTAQKSDTAIFMEDVTGQLTLLRSTQGGGLGDPDEPLKVESHDVTNAMRVILISDGIGEFLTLKQLQQITQSTPNSEELFPKLKEAVMSDQDQQRGLIGANKQRLKTWQKDSPNNSDDMSLAVLNITSDPFL